ncbi:MAG: hypothetical protein JXR37_29810 [Kiritimatiellae bacterium]|nr:hypothetical protein [Kiritimatiellia bacterium]
MALLFLAAALAPAPAARGQHGSYVLPVQLDAGLKAHKDLIVRFEVDRHLFGRMPVPNVDLASARVCEVTGDAGRKSRREVPSQYVADTDFPEQKGTLCWLIKGAFDIMETRDFEIRFSMPGAKPKPGDPAWKELVPPGDLVNLVPNGSFELTNEKGEVRSWSMPDNPMMKWDPRKARTGSRSLYCRTPNKQVKSMACRSERFPVIGGREYRASFWERAAKPNSRLWGAIRIFDAKGRQILRRDPTGVIEEKDGWTCRSTKVRVPENGETAQFSISHWRILDIEAWADDASFRIADDRRSYRIIPGNVRVEADGGGGGR